MHMDDDLNTADAITDIFNLVKISNTALASGKVSVMALTDAKRLDSKSSRLFLESTFSRTMKAACHPKSRSW